MSSNINKLCDLFPYLVDSLLANDSSLDNKDQSIESMIDSIYNYGMLHGQHLQHKVDTVEPIYIKQYRKINTKHSEKSNKHEYNKSLKPNKNIKNKNNTNLIGVVIRNKRDQKVYQAGIHIDDLRVVIGNFPTIEEAAKSHDRALIRAIGPIQCTPSMLNYPITTYRNDSLDLFTVFDSILRKKLFATNWTGPKPCDFGYLISNLPISVRSLDQSGSEYAMLPPNNILHTCSNTLRKKRNKGQYLTLRYTY